MQKAFTLIELLVVVLIIGILSAVALPKYQIAVYKTEFANMRSVGSSYARAAEVYRLETGQWPGSFEVLSIAEPGGQQINTPTSATCASNQKMYCCITEYQEGYQSAGITCGRTDFLFGWKYNFNDKTENCVAKSDNTSAQHMCKSFGGSLVGTFNMASPHGHQVGYQCWRI